MTKPLRIDDEAAGEVDAAAEWYQLRGPTLGVEFIAEVRDGLARVASFPGLGPRLRSRPQPTRITAGRVAAYSSTNASRAATSTPATRAASSSDQAEARCRSSSTPVACAAMNA